MEGPPDDTTHRQTHGLECQFEEQPGCFLDHGTCHTAALINRSLRYAQFPQAVAELGKLANNPNLSEPQKKVVNDLVEQTKQVIANSKAPP